MTLCFAALIKVLKTCSKQGVGNKHLCGAFAKTVNEYYGSNLETDDYKVGGIMSCRDNLSYADFVTPARNADTNDIRQKIGEYVMPLLIDDELASAMLALRDLALNTVKRATSKIGSMKRSELESKTVYNPVSFLTDIFIYTATVIENRKGKETINQVDENYVRSFDVLSEGIQIVDEEIIKAAVNSETEKKYQTRLLIESNGLCPNDNCCRPLYIDVSGQTQMDYTITVIDPNKSPDDFGNLIALCPDCSKRYTLAADDAHIKRLSEIKNQLMEEARTLETLAETKVEEGVERVLRKISDTPPEKLIPLNYEPVELKDKILPANRALYIKAKAYVTEYYNTVDEIFQQLNKEGKLRFTSFSMQVRLNFFNLRDKGLTQPEIFAHLVDWLENNTNDSRDMCEIVIAYFVQKCEVFDAITK